MIQVMTLNAAQAGPSIDSLREPAGQGAIDLLCCQSLTHTPDGRVELRRQLSATLGLTCSCFVAGRPHPRSASDGNTAGKGLATFTGSGVWVLNSGSFTVGEEDEETLVQFALIRKYGASVLALNLHLGISHQAQIRQLRDLFAHSLLREPYGAVALCADRTAVLTGKEWLGLTARSPYTLSRTPLTLTGGGLLGLLTARCPTVSAVIVRQPDPILYPDAEQAPALPALTMTFEIQRIVANRPNRPTFPLSFREQWLGYRKHRAFA